MTFLTLSKDFREADFLINTNIEKLTSMGGIFSLIKKDATYQKSHAVAFLNGLMTPTFGGKPTPCTLNLVYTEMKHSTQHMRLPVTGSWFFHLLNKKQTNMTNMYLELQTTSFLWLFQLDDSPLQ